MRSPHPGFWHTKTTISSRSSVALAASKSTRCPQAFNVASIQCRVPVFVEARGNGKVAHGKQCGQETSPPGQQTRSWYVGEPVRCFYWDRFHMSWAPPPSGVIPIHAHSETLWWWNWLSYGFAMSISCPWWEAMLRFCKKKKSPCACMRFFQWLVLWDFTAPGCWKYAWHDQQLFGSSWLPGLHHHSRLSH